MTPSELRQALSAFPTVALVSTPSLVEPMPRLAARLGTSARLFVKRDDGIAFAWGGNKVRKLAFVAACAQAEGADPVQACLGSVVGSAVSRVGGSGEDLAAGG